MFCLSPDKHVAKTDSYPPKQAGIPMMNPQMAMKPMNMPMQEGRMPGSRD